MTFGHELAVTEQSESTELARLPVEIEVQKTIEAAVILSRKFPRDEMKAYEKLMQSCRRPSFAEEVTYAFPRGGKTIKGPSINVAREAMRCWGNMRYGWDVITSDGESEKIRAWAWDMEWNTYVQMEDEFRLLIYRKNKDGQGGGSWLKPDERDARELRNRRGATALRGCLLQLLPKDLIEDAQLLATETLRGQAAKSVDATIKALIKAFQPLNVSVEELEAYLGHDLKSSTAEELVDLQQIGKAIKDGQAKKAEFFAPVPVQPPAHAKEGGLSLTDVMMQPPKAVEMLGQLAEVLTDTPIDDLGALMEYAWHTYKLPPSQVAVCLGVPVVNEKTVADFQAAKVQLDEAMNKGD